MTPLEPSPRDPPPALPAPRLGPDIVRAFAALMENAPVGWCLFDLDLRFLAVNRALAAMNGVPRDAHLGRRPQEVLPGFPPRSYLPTYERIRAGELRHSFVLEGETPASPGKLRTWEASWYAVASGGNTVAIAALTVEVTERRRAEAERNEALRRLSGLQEVTAALVGARTRKEVAQVIAAGATALLHLDRASVYVLSDDGERLEALATSEELLSRWAVLGMDAPVPATEVVRSGKQLYMLKASAVARRWPVLEGLPGGARPFFGLPLVVNDRPVGAFFGVWEDDRDELDEDERRLLRTLAQQFTVAFGRAAAFDAERRARKRMKRLRALAAALARATTLDEVAAAVTRFAGTAADATSAALAIGDLPERNHRLRVAGGARARLGDDTPGQLWSLLPADAPVGAVLESREPLLLKSLDAALETFPEWEWIFRETGQRSWAFWPLKTDLPAALALGYAHEQRFGPEQRRQIETFALQCSQAVARARIHEIERDAAGSLQRALLPSTLPSVAGVSLAFAYEAATEGLEVGGDWYDGFAYADGSLLLTVGDVGGHGVQAAAAMGRIRYSIAALAHNGCSPTQILELLNEIASDEAELSFTTLVLCLVDPARSQAMITSAGHPPVLVRRPDGDAFLLEDGRSGPLCTQLPVPVPAVVPLDPGTSLVLYTDGVIERRGASIQEGLDVLVATVRGTDDPSEVLEQMRSFHGGFRDDVVVLTARVAP